MNKKPQLSAKSLQLITSILDTNSIKLLEGLLMV